MQPRVGTTIFDGYVEKKKSSFLLLNLLGFLKLLSYNMQLFFYLDFPKPPLFFNSVRLARGLKWSGNILELKDINKIVFWMNIATKSGYIF